jgi:hypothetical protein
MAVKAGNSRAGEEGQGSELQQISSFNGREEEKGRESESGRGEQGMAGLGDTIDVLLFIPSMSHGP